MPLPDLGFDMPLKLFGFYFQCVTEGASATLDVDDVKIGSVLPFEVLLSSPSNGDNSVDINTPMEITFNNEIDGETLSTISLNGDTSLIEDVQIAKDNAKKCVISLKQPLDFEKDYTLSLAGCKDIYGQLLKSGDISFKSRGKKLLINSPRYYAGEEEISQTGLVPGQVVTVWEVTNETDDTIPVYVVSAFYKEGELKNTVLLAGVIPPNRENYILRSEIDIVQMDESSVLQSFLWNSLLGMKALTASHSLHAGEEAPRTQITSGEATAVSDFISVNATVNHKSGRITITGCVPTSEKEEVAAIVLRPGYQVTDIKPENISDALDFIGQVECNADGTFAFEYNMNTEKSVENQEYTLIVGSKSVDIEKYGVFRFKRFGSEVVNAILNALKNSNAKRVESYFDDKSPMLIDGKILLNEVLQLDLTGYRMLKDKEPVHLALAGKDFSAGGVEEIRSAFIQAVNKQAGVEESVKSALQEINDALWDDMEGVLKKHQPVIELDFSGDFSKLSKNNVVLLYKKMANDYTFISVKEVQNAFNNEVKNLNKPVKNGGVDSLGGGTTHVIKAENPPLITNPSSLKKTFSDLDSVEWAKKSIEALAEKGILSGRSEEIFDPFSPVTREEFVKLLVLALDFSGKDSDANFFDVHPNAWYYTYVTAAKKNGIALGTPDGMFGVGAYITRQDMAVMVCRAAEKAGLKLPSLVPEKRFADEWDVAEYAMEGVQTLASAQIINGMDNNRFAPRETTTRAMAAKVVYELLSLKTENSL